MLVVISAPDDPRITPLNTEKEQEIILEALDKLQRDQKIKVDFTEDATFENVQGYLNEQNYHIVSNSRFEQKHMWKTVKFFNIS